MREILFRGKRRDNGEWIEGTLYQIAANLPPFIMLADSNAESHEVMSETVGQFTGLTDKNGKRIFEGDILRGDDRKYQVVYYPTFAMYMLHVLPKGGASNGMNTPMFECEVIGNIYGTPELLSDSE